MTNIFNRIPEPFAGMLYMLFGTITLLDALGAINASLLVIIGSFFFLSYGFILVQGPSRFKKILKRLQKKDDNREL